jgi:hypothetical protein
MLLATSFRLERPTFQGQKSGRPGWWARRDCACGVAGFEAFDVDERSLGLFDTRHRAISAVWGISVGRQSVTVTTNP